MTYIFFKSANFINKIFWKIHLKVFYIRYMRIYETFIVANAMHDTSSIIFPLEHTVFLHQDDMCTIWRAVAELTIIWPIIPNLWSIIRCFEDFILTLESVGPQGTHCHHGFYLCYKHCLGLRKGVKYFG